MDAPRRPRLAWWDAGLLYLGLALRPGKLHLGSLAVSLRPAELLELALAFGFGMLLARGFGRWRSGGSRTLDEGDWVRLLWLLAGVFAVLALGPVIHVGQQAVGPGPYRALYDVLFPCAPFGSPPASASCTWRRSRSWRPSD